MIAAWISRKYFYLETVLINAHLIISSTVSLAYSALRNVPPVRIRQLIVSLVALDIRNRRIHVYLLVLQEHTST